MLRTLARAASSPILLAIALLAARAPAQTTIRVTAGIGGAEPNGDCRAPVISGNGRFVVFQSTATNLTANDTNPWEDVFVYDLEVGTMDLVSVRAGSPLQAAYFWGTAVSDDGNWVAFATNADDILPGSGGLIDVYLRDRANGTTTRVTEGWGGESISPAMSPDGRWITFASTSDTVVAGGPSTDIFRLDRVAGTYAVASRSSAGLPSDAPSSDPRISADGSVIAFVSTATNLAAGDTNDEVDVFVRDLDASTTRRVSVALSGAQLTLASATAGLSRDGLRVGFVYRGVDAFPGAIYGDSNVFVHHASTVSMLWASRPANGIAGTGHSIRASIAGNGRYVLFRSTAPGLVVPDPSPSTADVYVKDLETGAIEIVSLSSTGMPAVGAYEAHSISDDGRFVAFECATPLVPGDVDQGREIYVRDRGEVVYTTPCAGDGWSAQCVCGNPGSLGNGCENYGLTGGVRLSATGNPSLTNDTLRLDLTGFLALDTPIAFVQGDLVLNGGRGAAFGDGVQCAGGSTVRFGRRITSNGTSAYGAGVANDAPVSVVGHLVAPGTRYYQIVYFNFGSFCGQLRRNWSNSIAIVWSP